MNNQELSQAKQECIIALEASIGASQKRLELELQHATLSQKQYKEVHNRIYEQRKQLWILKGETHNEPKKPRSRNGLYI